MNTRVVAVLVPALLVGGYAGAQQSTDSPEYVRDEAVRASMFVPLDLPTPSEVRLGSGAPGPAYWQQRCDYVIDATLDAEKRAISATARITYTNNSPHTLDYIWMSLEQNLFNKQSEGARMTLPGGRFGNRDGFEGGYKVGAVRLEKMSWRESSFSPVRSTRFEARDAELKIYDTLAKLDLPTPMAPGATLEFSISWSFNIPPYGSDRLGIYDAEQGPVFQVAQWFPSVCVYDDVHGWNTLQYLGAGEFYTDFGDYTINLTVPHDHIAVCTGELMNPQDVLTSEQQQRLAQAKRSRETVTIIGADEVGTPASRPAGDSPLTWKFRAKDVRTVAWTSSPAFIWDAASAKKTEHQTLVQSVYPREAEKIWKDSTDMLCFSIESYTKWLEYPYPTATNVNGVVGGMEYPMIIFCRNRTDSRGLFGVTTHEIGHNWFPMIVSSDERRNVWMDEGFNTFINHYSQFERYGEGSSRGSARNYAKDMIERDPHAPTVRPDLYAPGALGRLGYAKPAAGLVLLRERIMGAERFDDAFRTYVERWAFKHPMPADFFRTMSDASGMELDWFFRGWFYSKGVLDQTVDLVEYEAAREGERARDAYTSIFFANKGELVMPVEYEVEFDDGSKERFTLPVEIWAAGDRWETRIVHAGGDTRRVTRVTVDPDAAFPDVFPDNNEWKAGG